MIKIPPVRVGEAVHYVMRVGPRAGMCGAAIVARVSDRVNGIVELALILAHEDEVSYRAIDPRPRAAFAPSRPSGAPPGTWHLLAACVESDHA